MEQLAADLSRDTLAALITVDADCRVHTANREAERLLGRDVVAPGSGPFCRILGVGEHSATSCPWARAIQGTERRLRPREVTLTVGDRQLEVLLGARPTRLPDGTPAALLTIVDVSQDPAFKQLYTALMADVLHDLRSPICSIAMAAHFLSTDAAPLLPERMQGLITTIQRNTSTLLADLNDLLNRSSFHLDTSEVVGRPLNLDLVVDQALWKLMPLLEERGQTVTRAYTAMPLVWADERRIEQVLVNLLANANKYSVAGDAIIVDAAVQGSWLRVSVEDHGIGVPPEARARVFDRYYRREETARMRDGVGLGLAIVKRIIVAHGGEIGVEDSTPQGARFWFTLPLGEPEAQ